MNYNRFGHVIIALFITTALGYGQSSNWQEQLEKGLKFIGDGDYFNAKIELQKGISSDPNNDKILNELAYCYYQTKSYKEAIEYSNKLIKLQTDLGAEGYVTKCAALEALGQRNEALKWYLAGIEKYPEKHELNKNLASLFLAQKEFQKAEYFAIQAVLTSKNDAQSHLLLSQITDAQGMRAKSLLAAQYYTLLESDDTKSKEAYLKVRKLWWQTPSQAGRKLIARAIANTDDDGFGEIEKQITNISSAFILNDSTQTEIETLTKANQQLFHFLSQEKEHHKGDFWWDFYGEFYAKTHILNYAKQAMLYMARNEYKAEVLAEISKDVKGFSSFTYWIEKETVNNY